VAGPDGGTVKHPVGEVWFGQAARAAVGEPRIEAVCRHWSSSRETVRRQSVRFALEWLLEF
jgi:nicotinamide mononucleotide (NMN) deamidase PncC